jgi:NADH:ubiquinone oxidoreductase subunit 5 (subunit L)/multisubunit Na+/H+ antiporter MnhA subunit
VEGLRGALQMVTLDGGLSLVALFPLLGAVLCGLLGKRIQRRAGPRAIHAIAVGAMASAAALALAAVVRLFALPPEAQFLHERLWTLVKVGPLLVDFAFALDPLSAVMILVITIVGTLIHLYATGYMAHDEGQWRFFAYLNLFVFSMLLLVLGDSFLVLFFGWEGVGLCSYLLIGFWYEDPAKAAAGKKAFVTNRVGDWGFLVGLMFLFWGLGGSWGPGGYAPDPALAGGKAPVVITGGIPEGAGVRRVELRVGPTLTFRELEDQLALEDRAGRRVLAERLAGQTVWGIPLLLVVGVGFFVGLAGKSAQIPLHVWLPDAMAGPTPVSALIHAATMVTAGVYLVARLAFLFAWTPAAMTVIATAGVLTAFFGAVIALVQTDIKRVLAYSTVSQLGFMILAVGVGAHWVAVFHLVTHACFKACLFLAAGSTIHGMHAVAHGGAPRAGFDPRHGPDPHDPQDLRNMGGLRALMPRTHLAYLVGCVAIAGFPIAAGFYSKDEILWKAFTQENVFVAGPALLALGLVTAGLTSFYMFRSYYLAFWARPATAEMRAHVHESPPVMTGVLLTLAAASIVTGPLLGWPEPWGGHPLLERILAPVFAQADPLLGFAHPAGALPYLLQAAGVGVACLGWLLARALYLDVARSAPLLERLRIRWDASHRFVYRKLLVDEAYRAIAVGPVEALSRAAASVDRRLVDGAVTLLARAARLVAAAGGLLDRLVVDGAVNGVSALALAGGRRIARLQTGRINTYVFGVAVGAAALLVCSWFLG